MPATAYVNGRYLPLSDAGISVLDRGFQFGDSLYEVVAFFNGRLFDWGKHLWRLRRGLAALMIEGVAGDAVLLAIAERLIRQARAADGLLYIQLSRGAARRDHGFPQVPPTLVMTATRFDFRQRLVQQVEGVSVLPLPDQRWVRCDLKTTNLLPAVLAKEEARRGGHFEALFFREDGIVTEGGSTNMWLVDGAGTIVTHPVSPRILPGVMRDTAIELARAAQLRVEERAFTLAEAEGASELFLTSTTAPCLPIVRLGERPVGNGRPGPVAGRIAQLLWRQIEEQTSAAIGGR